MRSEAKEAWLPGWLLGGRSVRPGVARVARREKNVGPRKKAEFDALFAEPLAFASAPSPPDTKILVFVDYSATFATLFAVDAMLLKWHPDVHSISRFVALVDEQSSEIHSLALSGNPS